MGRLEGPSLWHDRRASGDRLQQAARAGGRRAQEPRRSAQTAADQDPGLHRQGHRLRPRTLGRRLPAAHAGRGRMAASLGSVPGVRQGADQVYTIGGAMLERVGSGEHLIAYDIFGSYAIARRRRIPASAGYCPATTPSSPRASHSSRQRPRRRTRANCSWTFSCPRRARTIFANQADLHAVRDDVEGVATAKGTAAWGQGAAGCDRTSSSKT